MQETKDPSLPKGISGATQEPFTEGLYVAKLTNQQLEKFGSFLNNFYDDIRIQHRKRITRNAMTMLRGAIFALGTKALNNPEWKEHCASSLREIFHEWNGEGGFRTDFVQFFMKGAKLSSDESEIFVEFWKYYRYFTGIDHHEASAITGSLQSLTGNQELKLEHCLEEDVFLDQVRRFFSNLETIIKIAESKK